MLPKRNVGFVPFGFTRACAERIATYLADNNASVVYAAWYWERDPSDREGRRPVYRGAVPDGMIVWTSRGVLVVALRFSWGQYWIAEADLVRAYPTGESLPALVKSGSSYDSATLHGELYWFVHGCVPSHFD